MDFEQVLQTVLGEFERQHIRYAVIGGFALGALGAGRATKDIDCLVHRDDLDKLHESLTRLGYQRVVHTENVSQYGHADPLWGGLDFLHAFRAVSLAMLEHATPVPIFDGRLAMKVVEPEDVIGLKVQALANNPKRKAKELDDIEQLMELYGHRLHWGRIQEYFDLFELSQEGRELQQRFDHAE